LGFGVLFESRDGEEMGRRGEVVVMRCGRGCGKLEFVLLILV
jgi:hypothetical protein